MLSVNMELCNFLRITMHVHYWLELLVVRELNLVFIVIFVFVSANLNRHLEILDSSWKSLQNNAVNANVIMPKNANSNDYASKIFKTSTPIQKPYFNSGNIWLVWIPPPPEKSTGTLCVDHRRTGRVSFGRGGAEVSCANIFFHCLHETQVVLPEYYLNFLPENGYLKNSRGAAAPLSPMAHTPMVLTFHSP